MTDTPGGFSHDSPSDHPGGADHPGAADHGGWAPHHPGPGDPTGIGPAPGAHYGVPGPAPGAVPPPYQYEPAPPATPGILRRAPQRSDNLAVLAVLCSGLGLPLIFCFCVGLPFCAAGVIMGFFAQKRIRESEGALSGSSMAALAIVLGAAGLALFVLLALSTAGRDLFVRRL